MPFEVEIKVQLRQPIVEVKKFIERASGKWEATIEHVDDYFLMPEGLRNFAKTDEALRVRATKQSGKVINADVTYKGKKVGGATKTREEIVVGVDDAEKLGEILVKLGFRKAFTLQKWREVFQIPFEGQSITATLDKIEHLDGNFMELELQAASEAEIKPQEAILFSLLKPLGYHKADSMRLSYLELVLHKLNIRF